MIAGTGSDSASTGIQTRADNRQPSGMTMPMSGSSTTSRGNAEMVFMDAPLAREGHVRAHESTVPNRRLDARQDGVEFDGDQVRLPFVHAVAGAVRGRRPGQSDRP